MNTSKAKPGSVETLLDDQGIAVITFAHPASNALPGYLLTQLAQAIQLAGENEKVKVVVLKSGGSRAFCGGASFGELMAINDFEHGRRFFMGFANVINAMRTCSKLIICRVQGKAVGGGVGLASAADYCMATKFAAIKLSELAIGIGPFVVGPAVERKIGYSAMTQLAVNATMWRPAKWAYAKGMYADVFDTTEALDEAISMLTQQLAQSNMAAMLQLKKTFWEGTEHWDHLLKERAAISGRLVLSDQAKQAIKAIQMKKK